MPRIKKIVDAEVTPVQEEVKQEQPQAPAFNFDDVGEMVMVGRYKNGKEFAIGYNLDDVLKMKQYCDYGATKYQMLIEQHIFNEIKEPQGQ